MLTCLHAGISSAQEEWRCFVMGQLMFLQKVCHLDQAKGTLESEGVWQARQMIFHPSAHYTFGNGQRFGSTLWLPPWHSCMIHTEACGARILLLRMPWVMGMPEASIAHRCSPSLSQVGATWVLGLLEQRQRRPIKLQPKQVSPPGPSPSPCHCQARLKEPKGLDSM